MRKQTLVSAERYITQELKEYEEKIMGADERILILEARIYQELLTAALPHISTLQNDAAQLAALDCYLNLARVA